MSFVTAMGPETVCSGCDTKGREAQKHETAPNARGVQWFGQKHETNCSLKTDQVTDCMIKELEELNFHANISKASLTYRSFFFSESKYVFYCHKQRSKSKSVEHWYK